MEEHNANTRDRFIYIHATKHEGKNRQPAEPRMHANAQGGVIELFDLVDEGTPVVRWARF